MARGVSQFFSVKAGVARQRIIFEIPPDVFDGVQFRCVGQQEDEVNGVGVVQKLLDGLGPMGLELVPDDLSYPQTGPKIRGKPATLAPFNKIFSRRFAIGIQGRRPSWGGSGLNAGLTLFAVRRFPATHTASSINTYSLGDFNGRVTFFKQRNTAEALLQYFGASRRSYGILPPPRIVGH